MRKSNLLVQYWVDTGNAPYKLMDEPSRSDSGSSLSEEDCAPEISPSKRGPDLPKTKSQSPAASNPSSVDTAAYIISNANVTNKAEALLIVEGSRNPEPQPQMDPTPEPQPTETCDNNNASLDASQILSKLEETILEKSLNRSRLNSIASEDDSEDSEIKAMASSMRIADVLPTLKMMTKSSVNQSEGSRESSGRATPKSFTLSKKNRRKLYTGRDSPMDIIVSSAIPTEDPIVPKAKNLHPALQGTPAPSKAPITKRRTTLNTRRPSKLFFAGDQSSRDSSEGCPRKEKVFLKSLGLMPSPTFNTKTKRKVIGGVVRRKSSRRKWLRRKKRVEAGVYIEESSESSESSEDSGEDGKEAQSEKEEDLLRLCGRKLLNVSLMRLTEERLRKVDGENCSVVESDDSIDEDAEESDVDDKNCNIGKGDEGKLSSRKVSEKFKKIEVNDSQESDQSTIIMINCNSQESSPPITRSRRSKAEKGPKNQKKKSMEGRKTRSSSRGEKPGSEVDKMEKKPVTEDKSPRTRAKVSISDVDKNIIIDVRPENVKKFEKNSRKLEDLKNGYKNKSLISIKNLKHVDKTQSPRVENSENKPDNDKNSMNEKATKEIDNGTIRKLRSSRMTQETDQKDEAKRKSLKVSKKSSLKSPISSEDQESVKSPKNTKTSITIGTLGGTIDSSFEDSFTKPRKTLTFAEPVYNKTFASSDDESDFIKNMAKSAARFEKKSKRKSTDALTDDKENTIDELAGETVLLFNNIVDSDEEEIIEKSTQDKPKTKTGKQKNGNNRKSEGLGVKRTSKRLSSVKVSNFDDDSSSQSLISPTKKLKTETGAVNKFNSNRRTVLSTYAESESSESLGMIKKNNAKSSKRNSKRLSDVKVSDTSKESDMETPKTSKIETGIDKHNVSGNGRKVDQLNYVYLP